MRTVGYRCFHDENTFEKADISLDLVGSCRCTEGITSVASGKKTRYSATPPPLPDGSPKMYRYVQFGPPRIKFRSCVNQHSVTFTAAMRRNLFFSHSGVHTIFFVHLPVSRACSQAIMALCIGCIVSAKKVKLLMSHSKALCAYRAAPMNDLQVVTLVGVMSRATYSEAMPSSFKEIPFDVTANPASSPTAVGVFVVFGQTG